MRFDVLTLFPALVEAPLRESILGRAMRAGQIEVGLHDIRAYSTNKHHTADDAPYGGGPGMVMLPGPIVGAIEAVKADRPVARTVLLSPSGRRFDQSVAREYAALPASLLLVCGRYEGVDARVADHYCDEELSIGDYVLTGGELAALVVIDAVARLLPGVLGNEASPGDESMEQGTLEYPQYTRPRDFRGHEVPDVLLSGNHADVARWRRRQALVRTRQRRPDLFDRLDLSDDDKKLLDL